MRTMLALSAAVAVAGCGGSSGNPTSSGSEGPATPPGPVAEVAIQEFSFTPATPTIKAGTTVKWTNRGTLPHTVTSDEGTWGSGQLNPPSGGEGYGTGGTAGQSYPRVFNTPGTYAYHCANHPPGAAAEYSSFRGTITVTQ